MSQYEHKCLKCGRIYYSSESSKGLAGLRALLSVYARGYGYCPECQMIRAQKESVKLQKKMLEEQQKFNSQMYQRVEVTDNEEYKDENDAPPTFFQKIVNAITFICKMVLFPWPGIMIGALIGSSFFSNFKVNDAIGCIGASLIFAIMVWMGFTKDTKSFILKSLLLALIAALIMR